MSIKFALHPQVNDVRAFDWYRYGKDTKRYSLSPRYTCVLDLSEFSSGKSLDLDGLSSEMSKSRRQQVRQIEKQKLLTEEVNGVEMLSKFYIQTFERQGIKIDQHQIERMVTLLDALIQSGVARSFVSFNDKGVASSASIFGVHQSNAFYLFGASDTENRGSAAGTAAIWHAIQVLHKKGIQLIDLEGVNSPNRGWFKLSFGATLLPYFQIEGNFG